VLSSTCTSVTFYLRVTWGQLFIPIPTPHHKSCPHPCTICPHSHTNYFYVCSLQWLQFRTSYYQYVVKFSSSVSLSQHHTSLVESMDKQPQVIHSVSTQLFYRYRGNTAYLFKTFPLPRLLSRLSQENNAVVSLSNMNVAKAGNSTAWSKFGGKWWLVDSAAQRENRVSQSTCCRFWFALEFVTDVVVFGCWRLWRKRKRLTPASESTLCSMIECLPHIDCCVGCELCHSRVVHKAYNDQQVIVLNASLSFCSFWLLWFLTLYIIAIPCSLLHFAVKTLMLFKINKSLRDCLYILNLARLVSTTAYVHAPKKLRPVPNTEQFVTVIWTLENLRKTPRNFSKLGPCAGISFLYRIWPANTHAKY